FACEEAASTVCAPWRANDCAIARPMPRLPPVTTTTLSENAPIAALAFLCRQTCRVHSRRDQRGYRMSEFYVAVGDTTSFTAPVFFGDTITVSYTIASIDTEKLRATADIMITNQDGVLIAVATHLLKWVRN